MNVTLPDAVVTCMNPLGVAEAFHTIPLVVVTSASVTVIVLLLIADDVFFKYIPRVCIVGGAPAPLLVNTCHAVPVATAAGFPLAS